MVKNKTPRVSVCIIRDWKDDILMGKRNDNSLWTQPGGHLEKGECPYEGCIRELKEETGLDATDIKMIKVIKKEGVLVYGFEVKVDHNQEVDTSGDPDNECDNWEYKDPNEVCEELHVPIEKNVLLKYWIEN